MQRILVTGGAGFIGSHTVDLLLSQQKHVTVFDNLASGNLAYLNLSHPHLTFTQGDILDYSALKTAISHCDAVMHLAALPSVPKSIEDPIQSLRINIQGFVHILQAIRELQRPIRLVYASSAAIYGAAEKLPCSDETAPAVMLSPYALEKANNEYYADLFNRLFGISSLGLRYFNVYGVRQDPHSPYSGVIAKFIEQFHANKPLSIFGDGKHSRDFIHVSDVARANGLALQSDYCGVLNIATGKPETLLNLVKYIEAAGKKPAQINFAPARQGDIVESYATINKAEKLLGFRATTPLSEGIGTLL